MFDLSFPVMISKQLGNSVLCNDEEHESCQIFLPKKFCVLDLVRMWFHEAKSISSRRRMRAVLPTQVDYDRDGRLGCVAAWIVICDEESAHLYDCANFPFKESSKTFGRQPNEWWNVIGVERRKGDAGVYQVPLISLKQWANRLFTLLHAADSTIELMKKCREVRVRNAKMIAEDLKQLSGGEKLLKTFPKDFMNRISFIRKSGRGEETVIVAGDAGAYELDEELLPKRSVGELKEWVKGEFRHNKSVFFLLRSSAACASVFMIKCEENLDSILRDVLNDAKLSGRVLDYVAFSVRGELLEMDDGGNPKCLDSKKFWRLLKGVGSILMGTCKGCAWIEFSRWALDCSASRRHHSGGSGSSQLLAGV